jgi:trimeric autotransporter adhesin
VPDNAITTTRISTGAVQANNIATGAVTSAKLASGLTLAGTTSGTFSGSLTGNASTATSATTAGSTTNFTGSLAGNVTGTQGATVVQQVGSSTAANVHTATLLANGATNTPSSNTLVKRDVTGSFAANSISLSGNLSLPAGQLTPFVLNGSSAYFNDGNVGFGTTTPAHRLSIVGGPSWTASLWTGAMALPNSSAIAWQANTAGQRFGMGHTNDGFSLFRTASDPGTTGSAATYDLFISNTGSVGIGTISPSPFTKLQVNGRAGINNGHNLTTFEIQEFPGDRFAFYVSESDGTVSASPSSTSPSTTSACMPAMASRMTRSCSTSASTTPMPDRCSILTMTGGSISLNTTPASCPPIRYRFSTSAQNLFPASPGSGASSSARGCRGTLIRL